MSELEAHYLSSLEQQSAEFVIMESLAAINGWEKIIIDDDGIVRELIGVTSDQQPLYAEYSNSAAAVTTRTDFLNTGGSLGLDLNGEGMKLFIWDMPSSRYGHNEFITNDQTRAIDNDNNTTPFFIGNHSTHIMGTLIGSGENPEVKGMAPQATCYSHNIDLALTEATLAIIDHGMLISNHSYFQGDQEEDWRHGAYVENARAWDEIMYMAPYYLMVTSAGNRAGGSYPANPLATGLDDLLDIELVKNSLSISNCHDIELVNSDGEISSSDIIRYSTSNFGPTDDLRVKPDLSGNGFQLLSAGITADDHYLTQTGTSMAAPNVAGSLLLLQEHYNNVHGNFMRSATLKGLALHTADIKGTIGVDGPDPGFGWGMFNAKRAAEIVSDENANTLISERTLENGESITLYFTAAGGDTPLQASISWTDPAGQVATEGLENDPTPILVNDLDIRVERVDDSFMSLPWKYNLDGEILNVLQGDNLVDPYERVDVVGVTTDEMYAVTISHKGNLSDELGMFINSQDYTLIVTGATPEWDEAVAASVLMGVVPQDQLTIDLGCSTGSHFITYRIFEDACDLDQALVTSSIDLKLALPLLSNVTYIDGNGTTSFNSDGTISFNTSAFIPNGYVDLTLDFEVTGPITEGESSQIILEVDESASTDLILCQSPLVALEHDCCSSLAVNASVDNTCPLDATGNIQLTPSGGSGNYFYDWAGGASSSLIENLEIGTYTCELSDDVGCSLNVTYIVEPVYSEMCCTAVDPLPYFDLPAEMCIEELVNLNPVITGLFNPTYILNGIALENVNINSSYLLIGENTFSIYYNAGDGCFLQEDQIITLTENCCPGFEVTSTETLSCPGGPTGSAQILVDGAIGSPTYSWSDGISAMDFADNLGAGDYTVTVTDANLCEEEITVTIDAEPVDFPMDYIAISNQDDPLIGEYSFGANLIVPSGVVFEVVGASTILHFTPDHGVIVQPGGSFRLLDGAVAEGYDCGDTYWRGVDLIGDSDPVQSYLTKGRIHIHDSEIRHADIAISAYDRNDDFLNPTTAGGIMHLDNAIFTDCHQALLIPKYFRQSFSGYGGYGYRALIRGTNFHWTTGYTPTAEEAKPMIHISDIGHFLLADCELKNESAEILTLPGREQAPAILTSFSDLSMLSICNGIYNGTGIGNECIGTELRNSVSGFRYGIVSLSSRLNIRKNDFSNYRDIYMLNSIFSRITKNNFNTIQDVNLFDLASSVAPLEESWLAHYGLYMDMSTAYWVEDNDFNMAVPSGAAEADRSSMIVRGSGSTQNLIYDNSFMNSTVGTFAYDDNRGMSDAEGLKISCNRYDDNDWDINVSPALLDAPDWGISVFQGFVNEDIEIESAGNKFDLVSGTDIELELENNLENIVYYRHVGENFINFEGISPPLDSEIRICATQLTTGHIAKSIQSNLSKGIADDARALLASLVDGGNTQALMTEVILTGYGDALELYHELSAESPFVSIEVLIESIQKEAELPPLLLALILESNPHAAKSDKIQKKLDDRGILLDEYMREMVDQGLFVISSKEELTARLSYHDSKYQTSLHQGIRQLLSDVNELDIESAIETYGGGRETLDLRYLRIDLALERGNITAASLLLNTIPSDFNLDARKDQELQDFMATYSILIALKVQKRSVLTVSEISTLDDMTDKKATRAAGLAKSMLAVYNQADFPEVLVHPSNVQKSINRTRKYLARESNSLLTIFPNPASDYVIIRSDQRSVAYLQVIDADGGEVIKQDFDGGAMTQIISVTGLSPAIYTINLINSQGSVIDTGSIIVNR